MYNPDEDCVFDCVQYYGPKVQVRAMLGPEGLAHTLSAVYIMYNAMSQRLMRVQW